MTNKCTHKEDCKKRVVRRACSDPHTNVMYALNIADLSAYELKSLRKEINRKLKGKSHKIQWAAVGSTVLITIGIIIGGLTDNKFLLRTCHRMFGGIVRKQST